MFDCLVRAVALVHQIRWARIEKETLTKYQALELAWDSHNVTDMYGVFKTCISVIKIYRYLNTDTLLNHYIRLKYTYITIYKEKYKCKL